MRIITYLSVLILGGVVLAALHSSGKGAVPTPFPTLTPDETGRDAAAPGDRETATFGSGCFWCTEACFEQLKGVESVVSGYSGGDVADPTYEQVRRKTTGHAEVVQVVFDPSVISYAELLEAFWRSHDPTTKNRQGADVGSQYRSVILYHSEQQKELAEHYRDKIDDAHVFRRPLVTEIEPYEKFYSAEDYHQNYFEENSRKPYCRAVILPKLEKFRAIFHEKLKDQ